MSTLPVNIASLLGIADNAASSAAPKAPSQPRSQDFLSLLNASGGGKQADAHERSPQDKKNDEVDPQAVAADAPASPVIQVKKPRADYSVAPQEDASAPRTVTRDTTKAQTNNDAPDDVSAQESATSRNDTAPVQDAPQADTENTDDVTQAESVSDTQEPVEMAPVTADGSDTQELQQQWKDDLKDTLAGISQILATVIQALTQAGNATAVTPTVTVAPVVTPDLSGLAQQIAAPIQQGAADVIATTSAIAPDVAASVDANAQTELSLLQDIQSLLGKMQQTLQQDNTQTVPNPAQALSQLLTPPVQPESDHLQALTDQLQADLAKLSQLVVPQAATSGDDDSVPQAPQPMTLSGLLQKLTAQSAPTDTAPTNNAAAPVDIGTQLKSGIAAARAQLQQLKNDNEALFAQAKDSLSAQFAQMQHALKNDVADAQAAKPAFIAAPDMPVIATVTPVQLNMNATPVATAVDTAISAATGNMQSDSDSAGDQRSGGNQQQASAAPLATPNASQQAVSTANSSHASFAKTLEQAVRTPLTDQVAVQVKTAISDGSSKIRIQLNPAELGGLEIKINVDSNGKTGVTITAEHRSTLDLLQRDAQGLARALADAGLSTDSGSLNFNLRGGNEQEQGGGNSQAAMNYQKSQPGDDDISPVNVINRSYVVNLADGLDISI